MEKFNLIIAILIFAFVAIVCDYIGITTGRYLLGIAAYCCWFLAGYCLGKLANFFGLGGKL